MSAEADGIRRVLAQRGYALLHVTGASMLPTLAHGDLVVVEPVRAPRAGDIVAFESVEGAVVTHRVLDVGPGNLICRGDNRRTVDEPVSLDVVVGIVVRVVRAADGRSRPLTGGPRGHAMVRARWAIRRGAAIALRLNAEVGLLMRQLRHERGEWDVSAGPLVIGEEHTAVDARVLRVEDLRRGRVGLGDSAGPFIVPAHLYSMLPPLQRRRCAAMLRAARERGSSGSADADALVYALARTRATHAARVGVAVRRALAVLGVHAGEPGDAVLLSGRQGAPAYAHFFTAGELAAELREGGLADVVVSSCRCRGVELLRAEVRSSSGTT